MTLGQHGIMVLRYFINSQTIKSPRYLPETYRMFQAYKLVAANDSQAQGLACHRSSWKGIIWVSNVE